MRLIDKTKAQNTEEFVTKMNTLTANTDAVNDLESLSDYLCGHGYHNNPLVCAHSHKKESITLWTSMDIYHEENVISLLQLLKELHYTPEVVHESNSVRHGYRIDNGIILRLDEVKFPEASLNAMHRIVFGQCDEQFDGSYTTIPAFLLNDNEAKVESEVQA